MTYLLQDFSGFALGTLIAPLLFYVPGLGLLRLLLPASIGIGAWQRLGWAAILAIAILPAIDNILIRFAGMWGLLVVNGGFAAYGLPVLRDSIRGLRIPPMFAAVLMLWWCMCIWANMDLAIGDSLYQSITAYDMVKHAAVTEQIARHGIPYADPFFARDGIAGYYHYFYIWPAAVRWVSGFGISATMAFASTSFWAGLAVPALLWRLVADAQFIRPGRERRMAALVVLFCFVTGTDLLFMAFRYLSIGKIEAVIDQWNVEVRFLGTSALWVPHHLAGLIAAWAGMLLAVRAQERTGRERIMLAIAAGIAFSTMFGASIWVAFTLVPLLIGWAAVRLYRRDGTLVLAGSVSLLCAMPQLLDLLHGRMADAMPIAFGVRYFSFILLDDSATSQFFRIFLLPLNYTMEFGLFAVGTILYWRSRKTHWRDPQPVRALLLASAVVSILIASFLKSVIIYNDLGWRSILFAQIAAIVWTLRLAQNVPSFRKIPAGAKILLLLGIGAILWDLMGMRLIRPPVFPTRQLQSNAFPKLDYAMRGAYAWADANLPENAVLQQNPGIDSRSLDFGLYGRHWPSIADKDAMLFGASSHAVKQRLKLIMPIFDEDLNADTLGRTARAARIDYLLFTMRDPVWRAHNGPPPVIRCVYRTPLLCISPLPQERKP